MPLDNSPIGSVGHLVGASMETAGHFIQSILLDAINQPFGLSQKAAAFLWIFAATVALFTYFYQQKNPLTLAFILGPPIFFFLVFLRTTSTGAVWKFGLREYSRDGIATATDEYRRAASRGHARDGATAQVSWFFSLYNRLTSNFVNGLVGTIEYISKKGDIAFVTKVDKYNALFQPQITDGDLRFFISGMIIPHCSEYFLLTKEYLDPAMNVIRRQAVEAALNARGKAIAVTKADHPHIFEWLDRRNFATEAGASALSCDQLWKVGVQVLLPESAKFINNVVSNNNPEGLSSEELRKRLEEKFSTRYVSPDGLQVEEMSADQRAILMINEVAGRMIVNELKRLSPDILSVEFGQEAPLSEGGVVFTEKEAARHLRRIFKEDEGREKGDFLMAMLALPYVQGAILLFLSITFPLAAITWVIPGRHGGFLLWMGLWLWAKLWDVGFAVVMLIENILYQLLPHGPPISERTLETPWSAMKAILSVDPSYSVYMYYHLLAVCLGAVPLVTGLLVKKGGGEAIGIVRNSLTTFSGRIGGAISAYHQAASSMSGMHQTAKDAYAQTTRALNSARFDPIVRKARENYARAMADMKALEKGGSPGMAQLAGAAAETHKNILAARVEYLTKTGSIASYGSATAKSRAVDAVIDNFNSHDLLTREWNGKAQLEYEKAFNFTPVVNAADPVLGGGLELVQHYNNLGFSPGAASIQYLRPNVSTLGEKWNLADVATAVQRAKRGELASATNPELNEYVMMNFGQQPPKTVKNGSGR